MKIFATTLIGAGCRVEGPHGPAPCGNTVERLEGSECDCGCSAFGDCCEVYGAWSLEQQRLDALAHPKVRTSGSANEVRE